VHEEGFWIRSLDVELEDLGLTVALRWAISLEGGKLGMEGRVELI